MREFKFAFCQELFKNLNLKDTCAFLFKLGYLGIELAPFTFAEDIRSLNEEQIKAYHKVIHNSGLEVSALHWLLVSPKNMSISSLNDEVYNNTKDFFKKLIEFGHLMETKYLIFGSPKQRMLNIENRAKEFDRAILFFQEMAEVADKYDIKIAFEPLGSQITNLGGTIQESLEIVDKVNHPSFTLMLDTSAMLREGINPENCIRHKKNSFIYSHLNDPNELGPGRGSVDFIPILRALKEIKYTEWLSVEPFSTSIAAEEIAFKSIEYLKKIEQNIR